MNYFFNFDKMEYVRGKRPSGCILCLVRDHSPEVVDLTVWTDESFTVTVNLYPYNPGHLMIFPNRHVQDLRELSAAEERHLNLLTRTTLDVLDEVYRPSAYNVGYNMGGSAGASIDHLHLHVIPRYPREIGIADLVGGTRVLIESPNVTQERVAQAFSRRRPKEA